MRHRSLACSPASRQHSWNQLPKLSLVSGLPCLVTMKVKLSAFMASIAACSCGKTNSPPNVLIRLLLPEGNLVSDGEGANKDGLIERANVLPAHADNVAATKASARQQLDRQGAPGVPRGCFGLELGAMLFLPGRKPLPLIFGLLTPIAGLSFRCLSLMRVLH